MCTIDRGVIEIVNLFYILYYLQWIHMYVRDELAYSFFDELFE